MTLTDLRFSIMSALSRDVALKHVDDHQVQVYVPFHFPDGDGLVVHLRDAGGDAIEITDMAHTFMHIGYHADVDALRSGSRGELLDTIRSRHGVEDRDGELVATTSRADVGSAVFGFVQALLEVSDLRNLSRDVVRRTFREDVRRTLEGLPGLVTNYLDHRNDPEGLYPLPFLLNGVSRPIGVYDINRDENATEALLTVEKHAGWSPGMVFVAIERDQQVLSRRNTARLSQAFGKQFPTFDGHEAEILSYLAAEHALARRLDEGRRPAG